VNRRQKNVECKNTQEETAELWSVKIDVKAEAEGFQFYANGQKKYVFENNV